MGRAVAGTTHHLQCPDCATDLEPEHNGSSGVLRFSCPGCGGRFRAAPTSPRPVHPSSEAAHAPAPGPNNVTVGPLKLRWRAMILVILERLYWSVTFIGTVIFFLLGGFVPVLGGCLRKETMCWARVVASIGGIWFLVESR